ncbi:hypothetical protein D9758_015630 [Tetrapyrgos nigripes]|uniref:Ndc10 domain-containing protein n=1 Tax=Tetrapyrgos nigripes TaxID=182062 RepID=A0A8H5CKH0_9AGAR|nr:hypothetical protein D9758_015630 [Tetrapyrgos nigripes]
MGVPPDQVDAAGNWQGNTRQEVYTSKLPKLAITTLAGFHVGEKYEVPWAEVSVPDELNRMIFPFAEDALAELTAAGCKNRGMYNFLQLLVNLRPFFWRGISAICVEYPNSCLFKRLRILSTTDAKGFMDSWPSALPSNFNEAPTREAMQLLTARMRGVEQGIDVLINSLPYPYNFGNLYPYPSPASSNAQAGQSEASGSASEPLHSTHTASSGVNSPSVGNPDVEMQDLSNETSASESTPQMSTGNNSTYPIPKDSTGLNVNSNGDLAAVSSSPLPSPTNSLLPYNVPISEYISLNVLPLLPPSPPNHDSVHTPLDMILPPPSAFYDDLSKKCDSYPLFSTCGQGFTWKDLLDQVKRPVELWSVYKPKGLGDYSTVEMLWKVWEEGVYVDGVGRCPPLRMIEERWGSLKNKDGQGRHAQWRPKSDAKARKIWSNFHFFIKEIEKRRNDVAGTSANEVLRELDVLRGAHGNVNKLHQSLQVKKPRNRK